VGLCERFRRGGRHRVVPDALPQRLGEPANVEGAKALPEKPRIHRIGMRNLGERSGYHQPVKAAQHAGNLLVIAFQKPDVRFHAAILHPIHSHGTGYAGLGDMRTSAAILLCLLLLSACKRKVTVGPYQVPPSKQTAVKVYDQPTAALITTSQGNKIAMRMFPKTDKYAAGYLDIPEAISRHVAALPKAKVRWMRALSHKRSDGAHWFQVDYRRVNDSSEIPASEVISIYRFIIFRDHLVRFDGLLTKGDLEKDFAEIDRITEHFTITE
jgi:hypothetical protein